MKEISQIKELGYKVDCIETANLILRPARQSDFEAVNHYAQMKEICQFIRPAEGDEKTRRMINALCQPWKFEQGEWHGLMLTLPQKDVPIGDIVYRIDDELTRRVEIGYRLSPEHAGKGYVTEAAQAVIKMLFTQLDVTKVVARCDPRNIPSYKIMEKLGMKREAEFKAHYLNGDELTDQYDYGLLRSEWAANR